MQTPINPLGSLSTDAFLKAYWQKKPLVIRQALPGFQCPISAEELAGLSCEEAVSSRIILEKDGEHPWQPIFGPMDESIFEQLPESHWTLAINDLEKVLPELAGISDLFDFIPNWRFDDLLCSYAADRGSVGPHLDLYDVFIIQGQGKRRWQISTAEVSEDNQVADSPLRIQQTFNAEQEWILEPGDMIYIPPNISHHGVSLGESISFSVGYRAVSHADLLNDFIAHITQDLSAKLTWRDSDLTPQQHTAEITADAIKRVKKIFSAYLNPNHPEIERWFGRYMSDPKSEYTEPAEEPINSIAELVNEIDSGAILKRHPASRFAFTRKADNAVLYIDGNDYNVSTVFAEALCQSRELSRTLIRAADTEEQQLVLALYNMGSIYTTTI
ncbi:MAG TPA: cupin domain-containing protein [Gammaproteobacteria bacterium]|nr:cupin domain-containing protein [Gammaproteobacteria bacterium]